MDSGEDYHEELFSIDSASIIHEYVEKGDLVCLESINYRS
jgi:hypothetical protein